MIFIIEGKIKEIYENSVIVMTEGIGFDIQFPRPELLKRGETYTFYIHEQWKEDGVTLYGFTDKRDRDLFELMIKKVSGIGAKTALTILKNLDRDTVTSTIRKGDFLLFSKIPGIGEKTAKRIVMELGGVINTDASELSGGNLKIAKDALTSLGYERNDIDTVLHSIDPEMPVEEIVKEVIKKLSNG